MKAPTLSAVARHRGTDTSNPFPSSGESRANLSWHCSMSGTPRLGAGAPFDDGAFARIRTGSLLTRR
jgi:hypothetical protein